MLPLLRFSDKSCGFPISPREYACKSYSSQKAKRHMAHKHSEVQRSTVSAGERTMKSHLPTNRQTATEIPAGSNFHDQSIFKRFSRSRIIQTRGRSFNLYFVRGIILFHLGDYKSAAADFTKALRLNWRDERVVLWIDRAERAHRATLLRQASQTESEPLGIVHPLSVWDRPTCLEFAAAWI